MRQLLAMIIPACASPVAPSVAVDPTPAPEVQPEAESPTIGGVRRAKDPDEGLALGAFTPLAPGIEAGVFERKEAHPVGDGRIRVVRVDPSQAGVDVLSVRPGGDAAMGADSWAQHHDLAVVTNASMFHPDLNSVFALKTERGAHPTRWRGDASSVLVAKSGEAKLLDTRCDGGRPSSEWTSYAQNWRLIDCARNPTWKRNAKIWSHAVVGMDGQGRLLFIHARTPWNTRVLTEILLDLPIDVRRLMYAEGGPEASLLVRIDGLERLWVGSYETGFTEHDRNRLAWNLPSVLAVRRR